MSVFFWVTLIHPLKVSSFYCIRNHSVSGKYVWHFSPALNYKPLTYTHTYMHVCMYTHAYTHTHTHTHTHGHYLLPNQRISEFRCLKRNNGVNKSNPEKKRCLHQVKFKNLCPTFWAYITFYSQVILIK